MEKPRHGTVIKELTGMASSHPVGARVSVSQISGRPKTCAVERLDGTCCMVGVPLSYIRLDSYVEMLNEETYAHYYCPNCFNLHEVRLVGREKAVIDNRRDGKSGDVIGGGMTFEQAAKDAWTKKYKEGT